MRFRIVLENGKEVDHGHRPVRSCLLARHIETYCQEHGCEFVRMRPNGSFTEVTVTVRRNN